MILGNIMYKETLFRVLSLLSALIEYSRGSLQFHSNPSGFIFSFLCLLFCQAIAHCSYLLGLAYLGFCYYPGWVLLFICMVIPSASDLGSKPHCARYYTDLVCLKPQVFTVSGMYSFTLKRQKGMEKGNRKTVPCNLMNNGQGTPAVWAWNDRGLCLQNKKWHWLENGNFPGKGHSSNCFSGCLRKILFQFRMGFATVCRTTAIFTHRCGYKRLLQTEIRKFQMRSSRDALW